MTSFYTSCLLYDFGITKISYTAGQELLLMRKQPINSFDGASWALHVCEGGKHSRVSAFSNL